MPGKSRTILLFAAVAVVSATAGLLAARYFAPAPTAESPETVQQAPVPALAVPEIRPEFRLPDLAGQPRDINEWNGKVLLINFWATWCPPCIREMPAFVEVKEALNHPDFEILGIAIDQKDLVQDFVDGIGINYPILIGEAEGIEVMKAYGNRLGTLPYSIIVARDSGQ